MKNGAKARLRPFAIVTFVNDDNKSIVKRWKCGLRKFVIAALKKKVGTWVSFLSIRRILQFFYKNNTFLEHFDFNFCCKICSELLL